MEHTKLELVPPLVPPKMVVSKWYLKGFADGYRARRAVILPWSVSWSARKQYKRATPRVWQPPAAILLRQSGIDT
jgi:hypothetical protein